MEIKVYLKCSSMPLLVDGPGYIAVTLGESPTEIDYDELVADLNLNALADALKVPRDSLEIITPEEYTSEFDEDGE